MRETSTSRVRAHSVQAPRRAFILAIIAVLMLLLGTTAAATPPLRESGHIDQTVLLPGATARCGFDIFGHFEGDFRFTVFRDNEGRIVREIDTFPSFKVTVFAPSTGKSYTSASPQVVHVTYTDGAAIGSVATVTLTGLLEKVGGIDMEGGRLEFEAVVVTYDDAGIPITRFVREISRSGPHLDAPIGAERCAAMRP